MNDKDLEHFRSNWLNEIENKSTVVEKTTDLGKKEKIEEIEEIDTIDTISLPNPSHSHLQSLMRRLKSMDSKERERESMIQFKQGMKLESQEKLQESIKYYRVAFKLDHLVEKRYRDQLNTKKQKPVQVQYNELEPVDSKESKIDPKIVKIVLNSHLLNLPNELIAYIFSYFVPYELDMLFQLSLVCKRFSVLFDHPNLWSKAYRTICKDIIGSVDYKLFFQNTPHIRLDGIYIAVCRYYRNGLSSDSWNAPVQIVQYYRYIRFYADNTCVVKLTNDHPTKVVHLLSGKHLNRNGIWTLDDTLVIESQDTDSFMTTMTFKLKRINKRFNRLEWVTFIGNSQVEDYNLQTRNERAFNFSKVRSIVKQL